MGYFLGSETLFLYGLSKRSPLLIFSIWVSSRLLFIDMVSLNTFENIFLTLDCFDFLPARECFNEFIELCGKIRMYVFCAHSTSVRMFVGMMQKEQ